MNDNELRHAAIIKAHSALHVARDGEMLCMAERFDLLDDCKQLIAARLAVNAAHDNYLDEIARRERAINEATRLEGNTLARQCADLRDDLDTMRAERDQQRRVSALWEKRLYYICSVSNVPDTTIEKAFGRHPMPDDDDIVEEITSTYADGTTHSCRVTQHPNGDIDVYLDGENVA